MSLLVEQLNGAVARPKPFPRRKRTPYLSQFLLFVAILVLAGVANLGFFGAVENSYGFITRQGAFLAGMFIPVVAALYLTSLACALAHRSSLQRVYWPHLLVFAALFFAFLSALWSVDPGLSIRRSVALLGVTLVALLWDGILSPGKSLRMLAQTLLIIVTGSLIVAIAMPSIGVHHDLHDGSWRGLMQHKNNLGWLMAVSVLILIEAARSGAVHKLIGYPGAAIAMLCLVASRSATAIVVVCFGFAVLILVRSLKLAGSFRLVLLFFLLVITVAGSFFQDELLAALLNALGKSSTLTGRTRVWSALEPFIWSQPWAGYGYGAFWDAQVAARTLEHTAFAVGHAHNGFFDLALGLGLAGIIFYAAIVVATACRLYNFVLRGDQYAVLLLTLLSMIQVLGLSGRVVMEPNSFYWFLVVVAALYRPKRSAVAQRHSAHNDIRRSDAQHVHAQ